MPYKNRKKNKCWKCGVPIEYTAKSCQKHIIRTFAWRNRIGSKMRTRKERLGYYHSPEGTAKLRIAGKKSWLATRTGSETTNWKGGKMLVCGYVYILKKDHPNVNAGGYIAEHRLVMEKFLKRYLTGGESVHHKNSKRNDNRLENLELHTQSSHSKHHSKMKNRNKKGQYAR